MKITIYYFDETLGFIHGTPLVPIQLDVLPSTDVATLKSTVCNAADLIEDMMAILKPVELTPREDEYFVGGKRHGWSDDSGLLPSEVFGRRRLDETVGLDALETSELGMSIDIEWLKKCPVCGSQNNLANLKTVVGLDNIPDMNAYYKCSNGNCRDQEVKKRFDVRLAKLSRDVSVSPLPLITAVWNFGSAAGMYGKKTSPPAKGGAQEWEIPRFSRSDFCFCGATTPSDAYYCWNCGKKNLDVQPKPSTKLSPDSENLHEQIRLEGKRLQRETILNSLKKLEELKVRSIIVEMTFCKRCGAENESSATHCQKCGREMSNNQSLTTPKKKRPFWKFS
jgi:ribosomal protein L40E